MQVYGADHSPWVQAVLLGLHDKKHAYTLTTVPPLALLFKSGVMMPAAKTSDTPWLLESADILQQIGFGEVSRQDMEAINHSWRGVLHRTDRAFRFFNGFSRIRDPSSSITTRLLHHFLRSFVSFYMFLLIRTLVFFRGTGDPDNFGDQFLYFEHKLNEAGPFLGGASTSTADLMLFGIIQCHSSIPVPPLKALQDDPRLNKIRTWIAAMQARFADYEHLYSSRFFHPSVKSAESATVTDRTVFWLGALTMFILFPVTVPLVAILAGKVKRPLPPLKN